MENIIVKFCQNSEWIIFYALAEQDPLFIDRCIKEELIEDEWNETPYFYVNTHTDFDETRFSPFDPDLKLEEKYRIPIVTTKSNIKSSYSHLVRLYCQRCKSNSTQDFSNNASKIFSCEKKKCRKALSYQCTTCEKFYKHLPSAYRHVRYGCKGFKTVIKTEVKSEYNNRSSNTKVYNPYRRKTRRSNPTDIKKNNRLECPKCLKICKSIKVLQSHLKHCGDESIKCEFCPFESKYKWNLKIHVEKKHIKKENIQTIHRRDVVTAKTKNLNVNRIKKRKRAKITIKSDISTLFLCNHCDHKTHRKDQLAYHLQRKHPEIYPVDLFTCKLCKKNCKDVYSLNHHIRRQCVCKNVKVILNDLKV